MTTVYFVRHAEPNYDNHDDDTRELSPKGLQDRKLVTAFLNDKQIDRVFSSPYRRARETVAAFADGKGLPIRLIDDFRERRIADCWIEDFQTFSRNQWEDFDYRLADGESLREVQNRNIRALHALIREHEGETMVVGSHGTALSTVIHYYKPDFGYADFHRIRKLMPWIVKFEFENGECVSVQEYNLFESMN